MPACSEGRDILPVMPLFTWVMLTVAWHCSSGLQPRNQLNSSPSRVASQISYGNGNHPLMLSEAGRGFGTRDHLTHPALHSTAWAISTETPQGSYFPATPSSWFNTSGAPGPYVTKNSSGTQVSLKKHWLSEDTTLRSRQWRMPLGERGDQRWLSSVHLWCHLSITRGTGDSVTVLKASEYYAYLCPGQQQVYPARLVTSQVTHLLLCLTSHKIPM